MKLTPHLLLPLLFATWTTSSFALDCAKAGATIEVNECAGIEQKKVETKLNNVYQEVLKSVSEPEDAEARKSLITAQRAWITFREADCRAVYQKWVGGTIRTVMYLNCMQSRAETRIKQLEDYAIKY